MYEEADKIIAYMNKRFIRLFNTLKSIKFDEQNVLGKTKEVYKECTDIAYKCYRALAEKIIGDDDDGLIEPLLLGILDGYSPTLKFIYNHEVERKEKRCAEGLIATQEPKEVDTHLKQWTNMTSQVADDVEYYANIDNYVREGYTEVQWKTEHDEKVCPECAKLSNQIFPIDKIPPKPHYRCRCWVIPYGEPDEDNRR